MKGDFTRQTHRAAKHYSAVLMQQGRVQLDADWNEQQAINRHRDGATAADVVGPSGAPKTLPGFEVRASEGGDDLVIGAGHFYVDGILCENEADVLFTAQPDLRPIGEDGVLPGDDGLFVTYLEAWERHITALEDETIKETALAGPDTATRTKTVWQVRLLRVTDAGGAVSCATAFPEWSELLARNLQGGVATGQLSARSEMTEPSPDPLCILPPSAGYRRLENQLYRVEIHTAGDETSARFKWSRDNGTVASRIEPDENGTVVNGSAVTVTEIGKDGLLTFASEPLPEWLELTDDRYELMHQRGQLARVQGVDPDTRTITFAPGALPALDAAEHPVLRRWDQRGDADAGGLAMTGDWQALEDGVEVRFEPGRYREGDFWLIPARTAIGLQTGTVEWPVEDAAPIPQPLPQPPQGTRHHFARLALVRRSAGAFALVPGSDCRRQFPPLTAIEAVDVGFDDATAQLGVDTVQEALDTLAQRSVSICSLLVGPGEDLALAMNRLGEARDALICLRVGTYTLLEPLRIENRGHIQIAGAGPGTRVVAPRSEAAFVFSGCASVKVSNLHVSSAVASRVEGLSGPLTFLDCASVTVDGASVQCEGAPVRAATCITVRRSTQAAIRGCELRPGHLQTGALLVDVDRSVVSDNVVVPGARPSNDQLIADPEYRGLVRNQLITKTAAAPTAPAATNATVSYNGQVLHFRTARGLILASRNDNEWQRAINAIAPGGVSSPLALERFLRRLASQLVRSGGHGSGGSPRLVTMISQLLGRDVAAIGQGITVGGTLGAHVRIAGNSIRGAVQGIHVGVGAENPAIGAGAVVVRDNAILVSLPTSATRERHGIFVGNADSVVVMHNELALTRAQGNEALAIDGIRLFGRQGRSVVVRHNHLRPGFTNGVTFAPLNAPLPTGPMWIVTENVMEQAPTKVNIPARSPGHAGVDAGAVRERMRGILDNFA